MSDDLTRDITSILRDALGWDLLMLRPNAMIDASRAIAALIAEREAAARKESCAWAEAIERWFVGWEMLPDWSAADPWAELHRMICWEQKVALDPAVSEDARKLIAEERARAFEEAAADASGNPAWAANVLDRAHDYARSLTPPDPLAEAREALAQIRASRAPDFCGDAVDRLDAALAKLGDR